MNLVIFGVIVLIKKLSFSSCSDYSAVFATCSKEDIRVWNANTSKELLRIVLPNMTCHAVAFMRDGKTIISGNFH